MNKVKPKDVMVNLPTVLLFDNEDAIPEIAANFNTFLHGKVRMKYEVLGQIGGQSVGIFYLQRNDEFSQLREQFTTMIEAEEMSNHQLPAMIDDEGWPDLAGAINDCSNEHGLCSGCNELDMLHQKGQDHCWCGDDWENGKCLSED